MNKEIDDKTYLKYLLQSLNADDLKQLCRDFEIKGFSKFKKSELVEFILDSLAEEELKDLLEQKEGDIISSEINTAIRKINGEDRESITEIKVVNDKNHEIELKFKGFNWDSESYLSITPKNINDPERDCDCRVGSNMGFCNHFWVGFIYSLKKNYFKLSDWKTTTLPKDFEKKVKDIIIKDGNLINEGASSSLLARHKRITVYEAEITDIEEKEDDFQGNITTFYLITLKDIEFGPQLKKKSDFKKEDIEELEQLKIRLSEKLYSSNKFKLGDKITCNGGVNKDRMLGFMLKRVTNFKKK
ncbi:MAG: Rho termination factor N-terminal domain-containing protein [Candidatus Lokiarchaeota archaeon]|nr:Rho termination factor N-terminal domain-containing protein [Candidatus Lokiarchaeota archaeon]